MLLQMAFLHSFLGLSHIPLYIGITASLSILLSVDTGFFYVLAIVNSAAMNLRVYVPSRIRVQMRKLYPKKLECWTTIPRTESSHWTVFLVL